MTTHTFKAGDLVRHKAGNTKMVVAFVEDHTGYLHCQWQDKNGKPHSETYPPEVLEPWPEAKPLPRVLRTSRG